MRGVRRIPFLLQWLELLCYEFHRLQGKLFVEVHVKDDQGNNWAQIARGSISAKPIVRW